MGIRAWVGLGFGIGVLAGCATTQPAAVTRVVSMDPAALTAKPICFAPPPPTSNLIAQSNVRDALRLCETGARREQIQVVPIGTPGCAVVTVAWAAHATGEFETDCAAWSGMTWGCSGRDVRNKLAKVTITEPTGTPIVETLAVLRSTNPTFTERTFLSLCRVAFHQYPQPFKNFQFDEEIDDVQ